MRDDSHASRRRAVGHGAAVVLALSIAVGVLVVGAGAGRVDAASRDPIAQLAGRVLPVARASIGVTTRSANRSTSKYGLMRHQLALAVARRMGVSAARLEHAWVIASPEHQIAVIAALSQLGVKYRAGVNKPGVGFDCSGLTQYAWQNAGYDIPRKATWQGTRSTRVSRTRLRAGDLVVRSTHVYMYLGIDNLVIHAPHTGALVRFRFLSASRMSSSRLSNPMLNSTWRHKVVVPRR